MSKPIKVTGFGFGFGGSFRTPCRAGRIWTRHLGTFWAGLWGHCGGWETAGFEGNWDNYVRILLINVEPFLSSHISFKKMHIPMRPPHRAPLNQHL